MEMILKEDNPDSPISAIYEIPGEPALVINGVPPLCTSVSDSLIPYNVDSGMDSNTDESLGEWLEGREVKKLFGGEFFKGKVTKFDKESSWYRVVYDDGDFEDLEWHELQEVLLPLDITIPLKTLASKVNKKGKNRIRNLVDLLVSPISTNAKGWNLGLRRCRSRLASRFMTNVNKMYLVLSCLCHEEMLTMNWVKSTQKCGKGANGA